MWLDNKRILITGGTGAIGKALLYKLLSYKSGKIYIYSRDEQKQDKELYNLSQNPDVKFIIGDIRDYDSTKAALKDIDIVFHTAALKIVRICEDNPSEALMTNVIGTQNIIRSAIENGVEKVIFTSSDKAANPTTVMGTGKLYSERLLSHANFIKGNSTVFSSVRFGNVLGSRGCVLDLFKDQIRYQNYVTVTDPNMTRFICTIDDAIELLLKAGEIACGGEIFIKKMPSIRIMDLAEVMINYMAPLYSKEPGKISIKITGKHPSEKLYEELITAHESERAFELDDYYCILPTLSMDRSGILSMRGGKPVTDEITSNAGTYLTQAELLDFLKKSSLL